MTPSASFMSRMHQLQQRALSVGAVALIISLLWGLFLNPVQFFYSYLMAYLFWLGITLGCLAILMLHHLVGGAWGALIQRILEATIRTLPLLVALFVPLVFGLGALYGWARPEVVAGDVLLQHKRAYLNVPFFLLRTAVYFAVWLGMGHFLYRWAQQHEALHGQPEQPTRQRRLKLLSAPGLGLYALTVTFSAIDWAMSLEPHWYSTMYGVLFIVGQALSALAFAIVVIAQLAKSEAVAGAVTTTRSHDLGNLLLAFVMFWAYIGFSQFLIIWSGNLAEEIPWYLHRLRGGWQGIAVLLILGHFILPFVLLLMRQLKRTVDALAKVAGLILCMHLIDVFWLVLPALHPANLSVHGMDLLTPVGIGGIWLAMFLRHLSARALIPLHDPRLQGATDHVR